MLRCPLNTAYIMTAIEKAIANLSRSDLRLQTRIARLLRDAGWVVEVEYPYQDSDEQKTRHSDIVATRPIMNGSDVSVALVIECKYFPEAHGPAIIVIDRDEQFVPAKFRENAIRFGRSDLRTALSPAHHYNTTDLGVLYQAPDKQKDVLYQAVHQVIKPTLYHEEGNGSLLVYPIVVIAGERLYKCMLDTLGKDAAPAESDLAATDCASLMFSIAEKNAAEPNRFIVDIVHESGFSGFMGQVIVPEVRAVQSGINAKIMEKQMQSYRRDDARKNQNSYR